MVALGLAIHLAEGNLGFAVAGLGLATLIHVPRWMGGIEKAGDAKLLMGVGACAGWVTVAESTVWLAVLYIPVAFVILALRGRLANLVAVGRRQLDRVRGLAPTGPPLE